MGLGKWLNDRAFHAEWAVKDYDDSEGADNLPSRLGVRKHNNAARRQNAAAQRQTKATKKKSR